MKKINTVTASEMIEALGAENLVMKITAQEYTDGDENGGNYDSIVEIIKAKDVAITEALILEYDGKYYTLGEGASGHCGYGHWGQCCVMISPIRELEMNTCDVGTIWENAVRPAKVEWLNINDDAVKNHILFKKSSAWQREFIGACPNDFENMKFDEFDLLLEEKIKNLTVEEKCEIANLNSVMNIPATVTDIKGYMSRRYRAECRILEVSDVFLKED